MHYIKIHNKGSVAQEFQCHGYNGDRNITVQPNTTASIEAPDHTSGAIIAVHDGLPCEQAEITKTGFGGNDFIDASNIVGAGGNLTVQQVGDPPNKYKGDATFMQDMNAHWHKASQQVKDSMRGFVFLDNRGNVKRIGPPKDSQALERFVREFAEGKTYIGIGAWGNNKGDDGDNAQSSAGNGNKDILITYSDGNAAPGNSNHGGRPEQFGLNDDSDQYNQTDQYSQPDQYNQSDRYNQPDQYAQPEQYGQRQQYGQPERYDQRQQYDQPDRYNQPTQYNQSSQYDQPHHNGQSHHSEQRMSASNGSHHSDYRSEISSAIHNLGHNVPVIASVERTLFSNGFMSEHSNGSSNGHSNGNPNRQSGSRSDPRTNPHPNSHPTPHPGPRPASPPAVTSGPGIKLTNQRNSQEEFFFYENLWNGNGTAGANFDKPMKHVVVQSHKTVFVPLSMNFKGRVQRGNDMPPYGATWVEFQLQASDDHRAHGDISLQQGYNGPATIASTDGTNVSNGFTEDIIHGAPAAAIVTKPNGERTLATTMGNWTGGPNQAAIDWEHQRLGSAKAYVVGGSGVPDVASRNNVLAVTFY